MIHTLKKTGTYLFMFILAVISWSCTKDEIDRDNSIFKDPDPATQTAFDKWLLSNYTYPYNITFKYKMQDIESDKTYDLVPATVEKSIALAKLIKHLWIEVYDDVAGPDFTKTYIPRVIHLIGSGAYNTNNTVLLGTAEGGMKITLYRINDLDPETVTIDFLSDRYLKTMFHEFAHILHQTKNYSEEFAKITNSNYVSNDWSSNSNTLAIAYQLGFVSRYARKEANEDFVEILSIFVVRGQKNWDDILTQAGKDGAAKINQKFEIVQNYLKTSWNIDIYELRRTFESRGATMHLLDLTHL
jgi:substrate import-associated zinc metallohydrolase lipoprotein